MQHMICCNFFELHFYLSYMNAISKILRSYSFLLLRICLLYSLGIYTDKRCIYSMELFKGDSFYEYLIKTYLYTNKEDTVALEMYKDALEGIENKLVK